MKKFSVIVLAIALVMMMSVPFTASADAPVALSIPNVEVEAGTTDVTVKVNFETAEYLLDGGFIIEFPADKLELQVAAASGPKDPANDLSPLPNKQVNANDKANGSILVAFADPDGVTGTGVIAELPFKVVDPAAEGEYEIKIYADRLVKWVDGAAAGENLVTDEVNFETTGKVIVKAAATQAPTEAPTQAPTEAPTQAPTQAPTKAPSATGEATPWALLATVTVAGAALVVLSTKKSK